MRYRLRTLLIVLALGPPVLAAPWLAWELYRDYSIKMAIDEFNRIPVRPTKQPTIYEHIGLRNHPSPKTSSADNRK